MSSVKLKHGSGNGTIINGPAANPSADITLKVPSTTGEAGQVLSVATANHSATNAELEWAAAGGGSVSNLIINGAMNVAQRGASSTSGGYKTVDRWQVSDNNTNVTITQAKHALTSSDTGPWAKGFRNSYHISLSAAGNSLDGSSLIELVYGIEAQDLANSGWDYTSASSYITISFWFKCSTNQTFYGHLRTKDGTEQGYPFSFTASGNDTWTKITQSIPGNSNIQFDNDANLGCQLRIIPYMGANYTDSGRADKTWAAHASGTYLPDMANTWITAGTSSFEFTGVQLEVGNSASDYCFESYGETLRKCQRYYQAWAAKHDIHMMPARGEGSDSCYVGVPLCVPIRAQPTVACASHRFYRSVSAGYTSSSTAPTIAGWTDASTRSPVISILATGFTASNNEAGSWSPEGENLLSFDAEL